MRFVVIAGRITQHSTVAAWQHRSFTDVPLLISKLFLFCCSRVLHQESMCPYISWWKALHRDQLLLGWLTVCGQHGM